MYLSYEISISPFQTFYKTYEFQLMYPTNVYLAYEITVYPSNFNLSISNNLSYPNNFNLSVCEFMTVWAKLVKLCLQNI